METREEIYNEMVNYPLPDHIITYRSNVQNTIFKISKV